MRNFGLRFSALRQGALLSTIVVAAGACAPKQPANAASTEPAAGPAGTSSPGGAAPAGGTKAPVDFEKLAARESEGLSPTSVTGPEKKWQFRVPSKGAPTVTPGNGTTNVEVPIGSELAVHCEVLEGDFDAAGTIQNILSDAGKHVEMKRVAPAAVRVQRGDPSLFVNAVYLAPTPQGKALGELKIGALVTPGRTAVCVHDEIGFEKTFDSVADSLFESLTRADGPLSKPSYREASIAKLGPLAVGFEARRLVTVSGKRMMVTTTAMVVPASESTVTWVDGSEAEKIDTDDLLEAGEYARATNGQVEMIASVKRKKGATYSYQAQVRGKKAEGEFTVTGQKGLSTRAADAKKLAPGARAKGAFKWESSSYLPDVDPTNGTTMTYTRAAADPPRGMTVSMGKQRMTGLLDEHGAFERVDLPLGPATLRIERAFVEGKL
ncbi:MAG TPA: hypothetical protein VHE30_30205 [Polyangiaceae bacterium]|nr:hypothetical protein [Polyangiaceae bacterium]